MAKTAEQTEREFMTESGYAGAARKNGELTPACEDYLEMIYRISVSGESEIDRENGENGTAAPKPVRICELAEYLHVAPSSASRMAQSMALRGYIDFKRYGFITLTASGMETGAYLIKRHGIVIEFLKWLRAGDVLVEAERIEHYLTRETVCAMESIVKSRDSGAVRSCDFGSK